MTTDPRVAELQALADEEGISLPMPIDTILWFEDRGKVVNLMTGFVYDAVVVTPKPGAKAVCHLLATVEGSINI